MGIEKTVEQIVDTVGIENIQNSFFALTYGLVASVCARSNYLQKGFNVRDRYIYPSMAVAGTIATGCFTNSLIYSLASLILFTACSLLPKPKETPEDHSSRDEDIRKITEIKEYQKKLSDTKKNQNAEGI